MAEVTILTITVDEKFLNVLRDQLHDRNTRGSRMIIAGTIEEGCLLLPIADPRLAVVHWTHRGSHLEELNRLLWTTTVLACPVPVVVIADRYQVDQATTLYRMGVTEYISRTHHLNQLGRILDRYLRHSQVSEPRPAALAGERSRPIEICSSATARTAKRGQTAKRGHV